MNKTVLILQELPPSHTEMGVDAISSNSLTQQASWIDLSMKMD